jgi:hypothetical protein
MVGVCVEIWVPEVEWDRWSMSDFLEQEPPKKRSKRLRGRNAVA